MDNATTDNSRAGEVEGSPDHRAALMSAAGSIVFEIINRSLLR